MKQNPKYKIGDIVYILYKNIPTNNFVAVECTVLRTNYNTSNHSYSYDLKHHFSKPGVWEIINIITARSTRENIIYLEMHEKDIYDNANACLNAA